MTLTSRLRAALYARVSSDHQAGEGTIASQLQALHQRSAAEGCAVPPERCFVDDGCSGGTLLRPALERLRDEVAAGTIDRLYIYSPDRLARNYAHQFLLVEELRRGGVAVLFLNRPLGCSPEDELLLQVQGVIAEYERTQIRERCRRGKLHAARTGRVSVLGSAPYGYRYVRKHEGDGQARYEIVLEQARVVRHIFAWVAHERLTLSAVGRRLAQQGVPSPKGRARWSRGTVAALLRNPAYQGAAGYGKSRLRPRRPQLRPPRGKPEVPRRPWSVTRLGTEPISITVPALVSAEDFAAAAAQLAENRQRWRSSQGVARYLLQGLVVCKACGYAFHGQTRRRRRRDGQGGASYTYYCCGGRQAGDRCRARLPGARLEAVVWADVCRLLRHPEKVEEEYRRRLEEQEPELAAPLAGLLEKVRGTLRRLIDAYSEGLVEKAEFEPRVRAVRERLAALEAEAAAQGSAEGRRAELRLALTCLEDFADQVREGLESADWETRRAILRALVKRIEVAEEEIRIVYRVAPVPFVDRPEGGSLQDRQNRCNPSAPPRQQGYQHRLAVRRC